MNNVESIFAAKLLGVKAIKLQPNDPFTWASGWKSPFYCDNRKTLSFPDLRTFVKVELTRLIMEQFPEAEGVAGVATGAIAQGALVAKSLANYLSRHPEYRDQLSLNGTCHYLTTENADRFSQSASNFLSAAIQAEHIDL